MTTKVAKQYFGVWHEGDEVKVTEGRSKRAAALKLAPEGAEALHVFSFPTADEAVEAYRKEVLANEPTAEELAEMAATGQELDTPAARKRAAAARLSKVNEVAKARAENDPTKAGPRLMFVGIAFGRKGDPVLVAEVGSKELDAAQSEAKALGGKRGGDYVVEVGSVRQAVEMAESLTEADFPEDRVLRIGRRPGGLWRLNADGILVVEDGTPVTGKFISRTVAVEADSYWVTKTGNVHATPTCGLIRGGDVKELPGTVNGENAVTRILRGEALDAADGRKARGWCQFCAVTEAAAEADAVEADADDADDKVAV